MSSDETSFDFIVIGAGISGAAAAYALLQHGTVAVLEAESAPGYHSTGRSAALYTPNYGNPIVRLISRTSHGFLADPPPGFCDVPLLTPRGLMSVAAPGGAEKLEPILAHSKPAAPIDHLSAAQACKMAPFLRPEFVEAAAYERGVLDINVAALHQGFLRAIKQAGGSILCSMRVDRISRKGESWQVSAADRTISGRTIVNAAGAWADQVGAMAGASAIDLVPKRRTAILVDPPGGIDPATLPVIDFADSQSYIKPEAANLMASPGDETPVEPQDVQPEELDVAVLADWLQRRTLIEIRRIEHSWAGLRSFVADGAPVVGFDPVVPDFFWLAGQGGYGIMMSQALGRATASLIQTGQLPDDLTARGVTADQISPQRLAADDRRG